MLESGETLAPVEVAYETYGTLAPDGSNAVFVCHALTGDAHAAGHHGDPARPGWWDTLIGPGKPLDTDRLFVICPNLLGGCRGTTGPSSIDPTTGRPYGLRFPHFTVTDLVTVHRRLLAHLGVERLRGAIGGSLGGMQVLQWALDHPDEIDDGILVCASARLSAQNIAFSAVARASIINDEHFAGGDYYDTGATPGVGLAVARMMAHITYVSEESLRHKFGRERTRREPHLRGRLPGRELPGAPGAELPRPLRRQLVPVPHARDGLLRPVRGRGSRRCAAARGEHALPRRLVRHRLALPDRPSAEIARVLRRAGCAVYQEEVVSPWGHDSFLLEVPRYHALVAAQLAPLPVAT